MEPKPKIGFFTALKNGFKNYVNFKGRTRRSEYWYFLLLTNTITIFFIILLILFFEKIIYRTDYDPKDYPDYYYYTDFSDHKQTEKILTIIGVFAFYIALVLLPTFSGTTRRLHDIGKSGLNIFFGLIPFFGDLYLLYLLCLDSMKETNEYGPSPKYSNEDPSSSKNMQLNPMIE